jgi:flagellar motor protein MotB
MKSFLSSLGWILFLALAVAFLLFYNVAYAPRHDRAARQQREIAMWTSQIEQLTDSLKQVRTAGDTVFRTSITFDELFGGASDFKLTATAESTLRGCVPVLQSSTGQIDVVGYTDDSQVPTAIAARCPTNRDWAAAAACAVTRSLVAWGVSSDRVQVVSAGANRPSADNRTPSGRAANRRVEILVRKR